MVAKLKVLVCLIALWCCTGAWPNSGKFPNKVNVTVVVYQGPGDVLSGATAWYSCQFAYTAAIATAATQATCNLRRASDAHTCDVIIATSGSWGNTANCSNGGDNSQSASSFCNATTCSVTKAYDQTVGNNCDGSSCDLFQVTAADQPTIIFNAIGSNAVLAFNGTVQFLNTSNHITPAKPLFCSWVAESINNAAQQPYWTLAGGNVQCSYDLGGTHANTTFIYASTTGANATASDGNYHNIQGLFTNAGADGAVNVDGVETTGLNTGTSYIDTSPQWGSDNTAFFKGNGGEIGIWSATSTTSTQRNNLCHNQSVRWGVASC